MHFSINSNVSWIIEDHCFYHIETSQLVFSVNQLTGFFITMTLVLNTLTKCQAPEVFINNFEQNQKINLFFPHLRLKYVTACWVSVKMLDISKKNLERLKNLFIVNDHYIKIKIASFTIFPFFCCWLEFRNSPPKAFIGKSVLKICRKFTREHVYAEV